MELKDMLDPKQAKALSELMKKQESVKSTVKAEVRFVPANKMPQKKHSSKPHANSYGTKTNTNRSSDTSTRKSQAVAKTSQTVELYVIDNGTEICPIHKNHLQMKEYNLVNTTNPNGAALTIKVLHCTLCNKNYVEERKQSTLTTQIKRGYPIKIKRYEETKQQIESRIENYPVDIKLNTPIHILEETGVSHKSVKCPVHRWDLEIYKMKRNYNSCSVGFVGYLCQYCNRVYMLRSAAEELLYECGEIGIPRPEFITKSGQRKDITITPIGEKYPKYLVDNGKKMSFDINLYEVEKWFSIEPSAEILVSFSMYCDLEDHDTEVYWCSINVLEKSGVENQYVVKMGYCSTCERFYIAVEDYSVIYQAGKAKALVTDSTGEFDFVRAGRIFDIENEHLIKLQDDADLYIEQLKGNGYVSIYDTSSVGYEDIGRLQDSKRERKGLYSEIEKISDYSSRPYTNRVDIYQGKNHKEYYIGVNDYNLPGYENIISGWSDFGKKLSNYKSFEIEQNREKYKVKLRRQFEIIGGRLYGYQNVFSEEDKHLQGGLTDPFLIKVLRTRQSQHRLNDILLTIQEKQYEIIEQDLHQNIIVQGCAGSGKTMVLLHRLSYLNYNHKGLDLNKVIILTPNSNFNMHIQGLTETLSVSKIERKNIEDYYSELLGAYNSDLIGSYKKEPLREENVKPDYVNYVYSDLFLADMEQAFGRIFS
ncbi:MAG TPA: hypothetical protein VM577_07055, partial [Anaerovoracaceae bacterium]|nr:hypothetical protein [Anaerovoracaceae bacterium]